MKISDFNKMSVAYLILLVLDSATLGAWSSCGKALAGAGSKFLRSILRTYDCRENLISILLQETVARSSAPLFASKVIMRAPWSWTPIIASLSVFSISGLRVGNPTQT